MTKIRTIIQTFITVILLFSTISGYSQLQSRSIYVIQDTLMKFGQVLGQQNIVVSVDEGKAWLVLESGTKDQCLADLDKKDLTGAQSLADLYFDSQRPVTNLFEIGDYIGSTNLLDMSEHHYIQKPTMTPITFNPATTVYEVGDFQDITISGGTNYYTDAILTLGFLKVTSEDPDYTLIDFGANYVYSTTISHQPQQGGSGKYEEFLYTFRAEQHYVKGVYSGDIYSAAKSLYSYYPVLWGVTTDIRGESGTDLYTNTDFTKELWGRANRSVIFDGTGYACFLVPQEEVAWIISEIKDHNGFPIITGFDFISVTVDSQGLDGEWSNVSYIMIIAKNIAGYDNYEFQFNL